MRIARDDRGLTLVELMIVIAIFGVLLTAAGFAFRGWIAKYKVEDETKRFYADLIDARARAMQKQRFTFVDLSANGYQTFEDSDPAPDGDEALNGADTPIAVAGTHYAIAWALAGGGAQFRFDKDGLASPTGSIRLVSSGLFPDYDCITIATTRIRIGRFDSGTCQEK